MMSEVKSRETFGILDNVHGQIRLDPLQSDLMETPEMQRLAHIHQLGTGYLVYPGAKGTRLAHAIGVSHVARQMGNLHIENNENLGLNAQERRKLCLALEAAAMLHDVCHTPWSHALEPLYVRKFKKDHMDVVRNIITGEENMDLPGAGRIPGILDAHGISKGLVADLICKRCTQYPYLQQMVFGEVDADTLDYLKRDFFQTGVSFGHIDIGRLVNTMVIHNERLYFKAKGLQAVRHFLNARVEMYSAVYLHKKTRLTDITLLRAAERAILENGEFENFAWMTDDEFLSSMINHSKDAWVREMASRLKYRSKLFKSAFSISSSGISEKQERSLKSMLTLGKDPVEVRDVLEREITERAGLERGYVFVDFPYAAVAISESRFSELDIRFLEKDGTALTLKEIDPSFAEYISKAKPTISAFSVFCEDDAKEKVQKIVSDIVSEHSQKVPAY